MKYKKNLVLMQILLVLFSISGCDTNTSGIFGKDKTNTLEASGVVEAVQVKVSPQVPGQVMNVLVEEGDQVKKGDLLISLDSSQLQAQLNQASSILQQAQLSYHLLASGGSINQHAAAVARAEIEMVTAEQALEDLYKNAALISAEAQQRLAAARDNLDDARYKWTINQPGNRVSPEELKKAEAQLLIAKKEMDSKRERRNNALDGIQEAQAQILLTAAINNYQQAAWYVKWIKEGADEIEMALLDADVALAEANLAIAENDYEKVKDGPDPDDVAKTEAAVAYATAQLEMAKYGPGEEELALAQAQIDQAQAAYDLLDIQLGLTEITAPSEGTVLYRFIEPGELAVAGAPVIILGKLDQLRITVYLPEDRYGVVNLGDEAKVRVDSYPDILFEAEVIRIADQAEFTPRNVQTQEERKNTVYGVLLAVNDPDGKLKPGMPADVTFTY
jgi:multidrug resistance efflux pump